MKTMLRILWIGLFILLALLILDAFGLIPWDLINK
jgi:hypothetical protein